MTADIDEFTQRFLDALRAEGIDTACQVCGSDAWHAMKPLVVPFKTTESFGGEPAMGIACSHCGCLRIHLALFAEKLVEGQLDDEQDRS
jgi:hypothetical protein